MGAGECTPKFTSKELGASFNTLWTTFPALQRKEGRKEEGREVTITASEGRRAITHCAIGLRTYVIRERLVVRGILFYLSLLLLGEVPVDHERSSGVHPTSSLQMKYLALR